MKVRTILVCLLAFSVMAAGPVLAKKKKKGAVTEPGAYPDWQDHIDLLEVIQKFKLAEFKNIYVEDLDSSKTELPEKDDNTYQPVQEVLSDPETPFMEGLRNELSGLKVEAGPGEDGLVVRGTIVKLNPGSRAARYWGGFGAGAAEVRLKLEVKNGKTGEVLLRVNQERRSGFGVGGGSYTKLLNRSLREIGEDLALVLNAF